MPSSNPVDYGADPCGFRNSAWAINECLQAAKRCDFPEGTFLLGSSPGAKIINRFRFGDIATFTTSTPHGLVVGEKITLYGFTDSTFNGTGPLQFGFTVTATPTPTTFAATVPGPNSALVVEDGWINLIGGGYTSSLIMGFPPFNGVINNIVFTGKGIGKTIVKFADRASTKRGDTFGFNIQMLKVTGDYPGSGTAVGSPGSYPGVPVFGLNCKNTVIEGITFDGNYTNNSIADEKITAVERVNGINTYYTEVPLYDPGIQFTQFYALPPPSYTPPVIPAPYTNVSAYNQYISNVITTGTSNDLTFGGFGQIVNLTAQSFQRDLRVVLIEGRINQFGYAIYTKHPQWNYGFTVNDTITVTGFTNPDLNGTFIVAGFVPVTLEAYCLNAGTATVFSMLGYERLTNVATYDTSLVHPFAPGDTVVILGFADATLNGTFVITSIPSPNQFNCANVGPNTGVVGDSGSVYKVISENARAWTAPDVPLTPQTKAGVNSLITVAGINHSGENGLFQNLQFYDFGVGIADAETFLLKSFLSMDVAPMTKGATVKNVDFGYQGRNFVQSVLYPGQAESNTQCAIGGYSALQNPINVVSRSAGIATFTCVMQHTLRVGDVASVSMTYVSFVQRNASIATYTTAGRHFVNTGEQVTISGITFDGSFNGTFVVLAIIDDFNFTVSQVLPNVPNTSVSNFPLVYAKSAIVSVPDNKRFTVAAPGPDILPGLYLDGNVIMLRAQRIFASGCVFEKNRITGGSNVINQQSPVTAITVRDTDGAEICDNNFDNFTGTCFYVDSFYHYRTHIHRNSCYNISAFVALVVQDWYRLTSDQLFSVNTAAHKSMLIENNDVLLTGPNSWFYQTAFAPLDAPFLINNHDVDRSEWYYPTDYRVPISTSTRAAGISTHTTASAHELQAGMTVSVVSVPDGTFNGVFTVTSTPSPTTFTVANAGTSTTILGGANSCVGINEPIQFPWEVRPIGFQRTAGVATYTTNKAHHLQLNWHATVEGFSDSSFNDEIIVTGTPTATTFTCASPGPDVAFTSEVGNFFRYVDDIQIGCNTVRRLSGNGLVVNNGGTFGGLFLQGRPTRCVAPLDQFFYFDCPEGCLGLECDPGPCKPNDYAYRI